MSVAMWGDSNGDKILIGDEDCQPGDPVIVIPLTASNVLDWIKALATMIEEGEIINVPGEIGKCTNVE